MKKAEPRELMLQIVVLEKTPPTHLFFFFLIFFFGEDFWESLGQQGDQTSQS